MTPKLEENNTPSHWATILILQFDSVEPLVIDSLAGVSFTIQRESYIKGRSQALNANPKWAQREIAVVTLNGTEG